MSEPSCPSLKGSLVVLEDGLVIRQTIPSDLASHQSDTGARSKAGGLAHPQRSEAVPVPARGKATFTVATNAVVS